MRWTRREIDQAVAVVLIGLAVYALDTRHAEVWLYGGGVEQCCCSIESGSSPGGTRSIVRHPCQAACRRVRTATSRTSTRTRTLYARPRMLLVGRSIGRGGTRATRIAPEYTNPSRRQIGVMGRVKKKE